MSYIALWVSLAAFLVVVCAFPLGFFEISNDKIFYIQAPEYGYSSDINVQIQTNIISSVLICICVLIEGVLAFFSNKLICKIKMAICYIRTVSFLLLIVLYLLYQIADSQVAIFEIYNSAWIATVLCCISLACHILINKWHQLSDNQNGMFGSTIQCS